LVSGDRLDAEKSAHRRFQTSFLGCLLQRDLAPERSISQHHLTLNRVPGYFEMYGGPAGNRAINDSCSRIVTTIAITHIHLPPVHDFVRGESNHILRHGRESVKRVLIVAAAGPNNAFRLASPRSEWRLVSGLSRTLGRRKEMPSDDTHGDEVKATVGSPWFHLPFSTFRVSVRPAPWWGIWGPVWMLRVNFEQRRVI